MRGRFLKHLAATGALIALSGCVQATRHSNTMVFGTNTSFGMKVGTTTGQTPQILVGYDRQEAVILPLVANTASSADNNRLEPCDLSYPIEGDGQFAVHPCSLVAIHGESLDSYSVLASFGADFDASGTGAKGGLAQYFATGMAAQLLAATGGASVVATGDAAEASATNAPPAAETIASLYGNDSAFKKGQGQGASYRSFRDKLKAKITLTTEEQLGAKIGEFENTAGSRVKIASSCTSREACFKAIDNYALSYRLNPANFNQALEAWKTN